ncbi:MAG: hypothetical protein ACRDZ4_19675 [Egibacteraceae bacterium]
MAPRWTARWVGWGRFSAFWADVVKETFPKRRGPGFELSATATTEGLRVAVTLAGPTDVTDAEALATVAGPDVRRRVARLDRASLTQFETVVPGQAEGVYGSQRDAAPRRRGPAHGRYDRDPVVRGRVRGGRRGPRPAPPRRRGRWRSSVGFPPQPEQAFDHAGLAPSASAVPLWPPLAAFALVLAVADVGLRRLCLERADLARARAWLRSRLGGRPRTP